MKKVIKWIGVSVIGLLLMLLVLPYFFKDQIIDEVKKGLNENFNAVVDFSDVSLSLIKSFPHLQVTLHDLSIEGMGDFAGISLLDANQASAAIDFWSLFGSAKEILSVEAQSPYINFLVLPDGRANYDIVRTKEDDSKSSPPTQFQVDWYEIINGSFFYDDQAAQLTFALEDFDHQGIGNFSDLQFDLKTHTLVKAFSLDNAGISYFDRSAVSLDAIINVNFPGDRYTLKENILLLNDLELRGEGFVVVNEDNLELDLSLQAPQSDFRQLASILPGAYNEAFQKAKISGSFDLASRVWGVYSDSAIPAFTLHTHIENGSIQYPNLPMGIQAINLDLEVQKPDGIFDLMKILASKMQMEIGPNALSGYLSVQTPVSDPDVEGVIRGTLDLEHLSQAYPINHVEKLKGKVVSDIEFDARMSEIESKQYNKLLVTGHLDAEEVTYQAMGWPSIRIPKSRLNFSPEFVELEETFVQSGSSDLIVQGRIDNILSLISPEEVLSGKVMLRSKMLNIDEWISVSEVDIQRADGHLTSPKSSVLPPFDLALDVVADQVIVDNKRIDGTVMSGRIQPEHLILHDVKAEIDGSDIRMQGELNNLAAYLEGSSILTGDIQLRSHRLDLNPFMTSFKEGTSDSTGLSPFEVPDLMKISIDANVGQLIYTDMAFTDVRGLVSIQDQAASFTDCVADAFGGQFLLAGGYQTIDGTKPRFDLKYDMVDVQFSQIAEKFDYVRALVPIIQFLDGRFTTSLVTDGALENNFMPDLTSLNLAGLVETTECALRSFGPAQELAKRMKMKFLNTPQIKNSKNWIEVRNGLVEIRDFDYQVEDVAMQISGTHSLQHEINYVIKMKVPKKYLDANEMTKELNKQYSWLTEEASKLGFKLSKGEFININVVVTGTITDPQYDLKLVGMDGEQPLVDVVVEEVKSGAQHVVDSAEAVITAKKDSLVTEGEEKVEQMIDTITQVINERVDTVAAQTKDELKKKLDDELSQKASEVIDEQVDSLGNEKVDEAVDLIKNKLKGWKPFGKKTPAKDTSKTEVGKDTTSKSN